MRFLVPLIVVLLLPEISSCRTQYKSPHRAAESNGKANQEPPSEVVPASRASPNPKDQPDFGTGSGVTGSSRASYRPDCSPEGLTKDGRRAYSLSYETLVGGQDEMRLKSGDGFACKLDPGTGDDRFHPLCTQACPDDAGSIEDGWGWCRSVTSFSCVMSASDSTRPPETETSNPNSGNSDRLGR